MAAATTSMTLRQVHVITRHGSRRPLNKDAFTLEEETSEKSLLTPLGQQQHYQLGVWLRERYLNTIVFGRNDDLASQLLVMYNPSKIHFESSAYERTIGSANALGLGLFPMNTRGVSLIPAAIGPPPTIPVYTVAGRHNDIAIHGYDKCQTYLETLQRLYQTKEWHDMQADSMPLLRNLARIPAFADRVVHEDGAYIPLTDIWNVYDAIHVAKVECSGSFADIMSSDVCRDLPDPTLANSIDADAWNQVEELAHYIEFLKFDWDVASNKVGGPLWNVILARLQSKDPVVFVNVDDTDTNATTEDSIMMVPATRFFVTSAHYPTILGLLAALQVPLPTETTFVIPEYASALIVELYQKNDDGDDTNHNHKQQEDDELYVKIVYKSGDSNNTIPVSFTSGSCHTDVDEGCRLEDFVHELQLGGKRSLTPEDWCRVCENTGVDVCARQRVALLEASCSNANNSSSQNNGKIMVAIYGAGILTMAAMIILWNFWSRQRRRKYHHHHNAASIGEPQSLDADDDDDDENNNPFSSSRSRLSNSPPPPPPPPKHSFLPSEDILA